MAKSMLYLEKETITQEGKVRATCIIQKDGYQVNIPCIMFQPSPDKKTFEIEMTWDEAKEIWKQLTYILGEEWFVRELHNILRGASVGSAQG